MLAHLRGGDRSTTELSAGDPLGDHLCQSGLLQFAHELIARSFPAPGAYEGVLSRCGFLPLFALG